MRVIYTCGYAFFIGISRETEETMGQIEMNIASNLKKIRKSRNMSLDMMAEQTGVSKSMLGQIERGESNPTVSTIGKIVEGIKITFDELLYIPEEPAVLIKDEETPLCRNHAGEYQIRILKPYDRETNMEIYEFAIDPGIRCTDTMGSGFGQAYIAVTEGTLGLHIDGHNYQVNCGENVRFRSDSQYSFTNHSGVKLVFQAVYSGKK
jgi:transcriptional regulator with XRE-family HTH domain